MQFGCCIKSGFHGKGFVRLYWYALKHQYMINEEATKRVKILVFWEKHGLDATMEAFGVKRRTLFEWKKKLNEKGNVEALNNKSRAPKRRRRRQWPAQVIEEIRRLRNVYPNIGKDKIYLPLRKYCDLNGLKCPKTSTIGRLIKDCGGLRMCPQKPSCAGRRKTERTKVLRKPKDLEAKYPGHVVALDTIERFVHGCRRYVITFEDIYTRFSFAWGTKSHASLAAKEFFDYNAYLLLSPAEFNQKLMEWLIWYNTERPHFAFKNHFSPLQFMLSSYPIKKCNMYWTHTKTCIFRIYIVQCCLDII